MKKGCLKKGTRENVLAHLIEGGIVSRKTLTQLIESKWLAKRSAQHLSRSLMLDDYINQFQYKNKYWVYISDKGIKRLKDTGHPTSRQSLSRTREIDSEEMERSVRVTETLLCVACANVQCLPNEKPDLAVLLGSSDTTQISPEGKSPYTGSFSLSPDSAVFYSSKEVRRMLRWKNMDEYAAQSRFTGVVIMSDCVWVMYHTLDRRMVWSEMREAKLVSGLRLAFSSLYNTTDFKVNAVVMGSSFRTLAQSVTGKSFRSDTKETVDFLNCKYLNYDKISMYSKVFYVNQTENTVKTLKDVLWGTSEAEQYLHRFGCHNSLGSWYSSENTKVYLQYPLNIGALGILEATNPNAVVYCQQSDVIALNTLSKSFVLRDVWSDVLFEVEDDGGYCVPPPKSKTRPKKMIKI